MPTYYFHYLDEILVLDECGEVLASDHAAAEAAERLAYELAGEYGPATIVVTRRPSADLLCLIDIPLVRCVHCHPDRMDAH